MKTTDEVISVLLGLTLTAVNGLTPDSDEVTFVTSTGQRFGMHHEQDCCETVYILDVEGDPQNLVGSPIIVAEEATYHDPDNGDDSNTYTFYRLATAKGWVTVRWYGSSNGYYSERVTFGVLQ